VQYSNALTFGECGPSNPPQYKFATLPCYWTIPLGGERGPHSWPPALRDLCTVQCVLPTDNLATTPLPVMLCLHSAMPQCGHFWYPNLMRSYGGLLEPRGSNLAPLKSTLNAEHLIRRLITSTVDELSGGTNMYNLNLGDRPRQPAYELRN